jgi:hypothetical protein
MRTVRAIRADLRGSAGRPLEDTTADPASAFRKQGRPEVVGRMYRNTNRCVIVSGIPVDLKTLQRRARSNR